MNESEQADILLVDNGSRRAASTLALRVIARALGDRVGRVVQPVSLQHADRVPASELDGQPALVLPRFLRQRLEAGQRNFIVLPLFFGPSRALSGFIPEQVTALTAEFGAIRLHQAEVLCPLPRGEQLLADIVADNIAAFGPADRVVVVDHGSPIPEVTAVRSWVAQALASRLPGAPTVEEAVMERREGSDYDFNGVLLTDRLAKLNGRIVLAMLFLLPGRHAGPGGDIAEICAAAEQASPGLQVTPSPLVGEHPLLLNILQARLKDALKGELAH
jgi:hypothetical protein